jgi:formamidopyrimidine-DNA glycosylase
MVEIAIGDAVALFTDGVVLRFHAASEERPRKHQLLIEFEDGTALSASVQARGKPSPLSDEFDSVYFDGLLSPSEVRKLSAKALLATEQRIPGLGNGVLQDILHRARVHPRRKTATLTDGEQVALFESVKSTLQEMTAQGGRDTERDLFGQPGGYRTRLSRNTVDRPCPVCGGAIIKQAYMGGAVYFCEGCQKL